MANKNITQLTPQAGSADPTSLLYTVTGGNTDKSLPLSVLFNAPTFTGTVTFSGSILGTSSGSITLPGNNSFYAPSAIITRLRDRLFVSDAVLNNGTQVASQPDWLTTFQLATGRTGGFIQLANMAVLNGSDPQNQNTMVVANRSSTNTLSGGGIGAIIMGINNNTSVTGSSYATYMEAYRMTGVSGGVTGLEIDTYNSSGNVTIHPYAQNVAQTIALQLAAGAELAAGGQFPAQAAINIQNNNATFDKGIMFGSNAITGADGTTGTATAIAFGKGHTIQWYGAGGVTTSSLLCTGTTTAARIQQLLSDNLVSFSNASGKVILQALGVASGVNGVQVLGAATGQAPAVQAIGDDTNILLSVTGKGTGGVRIQGVTDGSVAAAGYVGETMSATFSAVNITTSNVAQSLASITLTPGDWDVTGYVMYTVGTGATMTIWLAGLNTVTNALPSVGNYFQSGGSLTATGGASAPTPVSRQNVTTNTTVFMVGQAVFSGGAVTATGFLRARRMR